MLFFSFCGLEEKKKREAWEKKSVSLHFTGSKETAGHANSSPQTVNNTHSSVLPPPQPSRSVAKTDGDTSLGSFVATIKGIPFPLSQTRPQNIPRQESYGLKYRNMVHGQKKKRGGEVNSSRDEKSIIFFSTCLGLPFFLLPIISERAF